MTMALHSMTGYARRAVGQGAEAVWELKSVNGRALDMRFRLPSGIDRLEPDLRQRVQSTFRRGSITATLTLGDAAPGALPALDRAALDAVLALRAELAVTHRLAPSTIEGLLTVRGVMTDGRSDGAPVADALLLAAFDEGLAQLKTMREAEGADIGAVVAQQIDTIASLAAQAAQDPSLTLEAITARLAAQIAAISRATPELDAQRLHAEAALLATKADIREEIDRINIHVASIRTLMLGGESAGRKLDFLAQELNREANTLCSKANAASLTAIGLDLKVTIDQFREQIQNLE
jgi:uncharacterized protein (TIGR00255 family)